MASAEFQPGWFSKPGDTVARLLAQQEISMDMLAQKIGRETRFIFDLLNGKIAINGEIAHMLASFVGGTAEFWLRRQQKFENDLERVARSVPAAKAKVWQKSLPFKEMVSAGWVDDDGSHVSKLKAYLKYFQVSDIDEWHERYIASQSDYAFRASPSFESRAGALSAWLRYGEILAQYSNCRKWNLETFKKKLFEIRVLCKSKKPAYFLPKIKALSAEAGVAVVFVRAPSGCRASGAARFLSPSKAMIILSFRHLSDDHFWFTFFHEAGHIILHKEAGTFIDSDESITSIMEDEANQFSENILIPIYKHNELRCLEPKADAIIRFSVSIGVSPGIVVGQMQHMGIVPPDKLNRLKRRYKWEDLLPVIDRANLENE